MKTGKRNEKINWPIFFCLQALRLCFWLCKRLELLRTSLFFFLFCVNVWWKKGNRAKIFFLLDFIYLQLPSIYCSSNMAPIPVNMEINAYFISIWAVANALPFSELQWVGLYWITSISSVAPRDAAEEMEVFSRHRNSWPYAGEY